MRKCSIELHEIEQQTRIIFVRDLLNVNNIISVASIILIVIA